jgi:hypothetical protein
MHAEPLQLPFGFGSGCMVAAFHCGLQAREPPQRPVAHALWKGSGHGNLDDWNGVSFHSPKKLNDCR